MALVRALLVTGGPMPLSLVTEDRSTCPGITVFIDILPPVVSILLVPNVHTELQNRCRKARFRYETHIT